MSDLRDFVVLQARVFEFLEKQDEATLQAIATGAVRLSLLRGDGSPESDHPAAAQPVAAVLPVAPSGDPLQAAQDLRKLTSEDERRSYLTAVKRNMNELRKIAKNCELPKYSHLRRDEIISLIVSPKIVEQDGRSSGTTRRVAAPSTASPKSNVDAAAVAAHLRETGTEEEGAAYLEAGQLDRDDLLAVAAELKLTRVERLSQKELTRRVLKQAIGARRKFEGLRKW